MTKKERETIISALDKILTVDSFNEGITDLMYLVNLRPPKSLDYKYQKLNSDKFSKISIFDLWKHSKD